MGKTNLELYVVYGSDFDGTFGHKYFSNKSQALKYKSLQEKINNFDFVKYYIESIAVEDESIDYSQAKLFKVLSIEYCNYGSPDNTLEESRDERKINFYIDNKENDFHKQPNINITVGDYNKPQITIQYYICIEKENNIDDILTICTKANKLILNRAIQLIKENLEVGKHNDTSHDFIVSKTLETEFNNYIAESFSAYIF